MMLDDINILPLEDADTYWEPTSREDCISRHFTFEQWEYIMGKDFSEDRFFYFWRITRFILNLTLTKGRMEMFLLLFT